MTLRKLALATSALLVLNGAAFAQSGTTSGPASGGDVKPGDGRSTEKMSPSDAAKAPGSMGKTGGESGPAPAKPTKDTSKMPMPE